MDLIPCEICGTRIPPDQYQLHINICFQSSPGDTRVRDVDHHNRHPVPSSFATASFDTIPCDQCHKQIPLSEYDSHLLMHSLSSPPAALPTTTTTTTTSSHNNHNHHHHRHSFGGTIPCDKCHKHIPVEQYEQHQLEHLDDDSAHHHTSTGHGSQRLVECKYSDCSIKWVPKHEYADHLTLHELQSQEKPVTANDELIAYNEQAQLIQQQTAVLPSARMPDPRRICLSPSFSHLRGTQKPVIPMHDALRTDSMHSAAGLSQRSRSTAPRDEHYVNDIIEAIDRVLSSRTHIEYYLCDSLQFYYRGSEDYSWGCGFRNLQTLSSSLIRCKSLTHSSQRASSVYHDELFHGLSFSPIIEQLQRYLDYAHVAGFDPEGLKELGLTQGKRVWIGAVDVTALLRSFNVPAAIFDFQLSHRQQSQSQTTNQQAPPQVYHDDLFEWVGQYFKQRYQYHQLRRSAAPPTTTTTTTSATTSSTSQPRSSSPQQALISSYFPSAATMASCANTTCDDDDDDDEMLQKALAMSKAKTKTKTKTKRSRKASCGKMEMDEDSDSDSGSSFSDDGVENMAPYGRSRAHGDTDVDDDDDDDSEEKKEDRVWPYKHNHKQQPGKEQHAQVQKQKQKPEAETKRRFIPPLYFQHQGHSRTIIGTMYNKRSGVQHLLVLDPSVRKGAIHLLQSIKNGNLQSLQRSKKQVLANKYQIVAVPSYGMMSDDDKNRCKTIQSMDVTLMNKDQSFSDNN